jgi:N-acetylated-alpha-linked acidic dipeptidase
VARFARVCLLVALGLTAGACSRGGDSLPFGFARESARVQLELEARFQALPDPSRIRDVHRVLTSKPHPAGSARDRELAQWTAARFREAGLEDVQIVAHDVMLPRPVEIAVELLGPQPWRAAMSELPLDDDPDTAIATAEAGIPFHAFSASGEVTAPVIYAGRGEASDYDWLARQRIDVRRRIVIVRHSGPVRYRGAAAWEAQQRGAAGILMYRDPRDEAGEGSARYPADREKDESRIERGSIAFDFLAPGDPLTPGWASEPGARRVGGKEAVSLPAIVSLPLSAADARPILQALGGPPVPERLGSDLVADLRAGPGPARVRMAVRTDDSIRPVWTVTGVLRGRDPDGATVIVGNHRDAWIYGGVDPGTGSAMLIELARTCGALARDGWRPARSLLFASWDGEEAALTSSTEWGESREAWLREKAVAYLNVDSAASGTRFVAGAVPSLMRVIAEAAGAVRDPVTRMTVAAAERSRKAAERGSESRGASREVVDDRLGGGSDYAVFLNHIGVPSADLAFDGPAAAYHSVYDTHRFVARVADPDFRYTTTLVRVLGVTALRLLQADAIPLDVRETVVAIRRFSTELELPAGDPAVAASLADLQRALGELEQAATAVDGAREAAIAAGDAARLSDLNRRAVAFERAFTDPAGLRGRPWYRHLIHAPAPTYAPMVLPGLAEAIAAGDQAQAGQELLRLAQAVRRAVTVLASRGM